MATLAVVKDLEVLKHRVSKLNASAPSFSVEQLDLHPTPKGLHHGVVETVAHRAHRWQKSRVDGSSREGPRSELSALVAVNHGVVGRTALVDCHAKGVGDKGVLGEPSIDHPITRRDHASSTTAQ